MKVWVVRRFDDPVSPTILSAWSDVYDAKFEATRWEQNSKIKHDYVEGELTVDVLIETPLVECSLVEEPEHDYPACVERGCDLHPWVL